MGQEGKNHHPPTSARHNARCLRFAASRVTTLLSTGTRHVSVSACAASLKSSSVFMRFAVSYVAAAVILSKWLFNEPWQARLNFKLALQPRFWSFASGMHQTFLNAAKSQGQMQQLLRMWVQFRYVSCSKPKLTSANNIGKTAVFNVWTYQ